MSEHEKVLVTVCEEEEEEDEVRKTRSVLLSEPSMRASHIPGEPRRGSPHVSICVRGRVRVDSGSESDGDENDYLSNALPLLLWISVGRN